MKSIILFVFTVYSVIYSDVVYRIPIQGTIDLGLPPYISRELAEAEKNRALAVIFDIDTFGGRVDAATQIKDAIHRTRIALLLFACISLFCTMTGQDAVHPVVTLVAGVLPPLVIRTCHRDLHGPW